MGFEIKVVSAAGSLRVSVPQQLAKELGLRRGDIVQMMLVQVGTEGSKAILVKKKIKS